MSATTSPTAASRRRAVRAGALALALVVLIALRAATLSPSGVQLHGAGTRIVQLSGETPRPAWPAVGEAALAVPGIGELGSSPSRTPLPIASVTKVMTAYLTLVQHPLRGTDGGFTVTLTPSDAREYARDAARGGSVVAVRAGEQLDERQLLEALLVPSGDDIAELLAAHLAGSVPRFVTEMNRTARTLGMTATTYTDPSGYEPSTVSTAGDQLRLLERAMRLPVFRAIVSMPSVTLPVAGTVENYDPLLAEGYEGKTGSDSAAEGCLAFFKRVLLAGRRVTIAGVVLDQGEGSDTSVILDAAGDAAARLVSSVLPAIGVHGVLPAGDHVLTATGATGATVAGASDAPLSVIGWGGLTERLTILPGRLGTGLAAGRQLATATLAGELPTPAGAATHADIRATAALAAPGLGWRLGHLL